MSNIQIEPYLGLFYGQEAKYSQLTPLEQENVDILVARGDPKLKPVRQYTLDGDSVVVFNARVEAKEEYTQLRIKQLREQLKYIVANSLTK